MTATTMPEGPAGCGGGGQRGGGAGCLVFCVKKYHQEGTTAGHLSIPITTPLSPPAPQYMLSIPYHHCILATGDSPYTSDR